MWLIIYTIFLLFFKEIYCVIYVDTIAGNIFGYSDGYQTNSLFSKPTDISCSPDGSYALITDYFNHRIRKLILSTNQVITVAGGNTYGYYNGYYTNALFYNPSSIDFSPDGTFVLITDSNNHAIRKFNVLNGEVTTIVGKGISGRNNGAGTSVLFYNPSGIRISSQGTYAIIADQSNNQIRKLIISTKVVTLLAGSKSGGLGSKNGVGTKASFYLPTGLEIDFFDNYALVVDTNNHRIRKLMLSTAVVSTLVGGNSYGSINGIGTVALFNYPNSITFSLDYSYVLITDKNNNQIRKVILSTREVSLFLGSLNTFLGSTDGSSDVALFFYPAGITFSFDGYFAYLCDYNNNRIRRITISTTDSPTTLPSFEPSVQPTFLPSFIPTLLPTLSPTFLPTTRPTIQPSFPTVNPTFLPSTRPTYAPTDIPSSIPTIEPSTNPTFSPTTEPTLFPTTGTPTGNPTGNPTSPTSTPTTSPPSTIPTSVPTFQPTNKVYYGFQFQYALMTIPPSIVVVIICGFIAIGFDFILILVLLFPTLNLIFDSLYFATSDFFNLWFFVLTGVFLLIVPLVNLIIFILRDNVSIPSPITWAAFSWVFKFEDYTLYYAEQPLFRLESPNPLIFYSLLIVLIMSFILQIVVYVFCIILYPFLFLLWLFVGYILVLTKIFSIISIHHSWKNFFTIGVVEPVNNEGNNKIFVGTLHFLIISQIISESIIQQAIQITNNQYLGSWSIIAIISVACSALMIFIEFYQYVYYLYFKGKSLDEIPLNKFSQPVNE